MICKRNFLVLVLTASALGLGACGGQGSGTADVQSGERGGMTANSSEELLAAEGSWHMVEADSAPNPLQKHLQARVQVDPSQPTKSKNYTSSAAESPAGEEVHFRVLRLESEVAGLQNDFKKLLPAKSNLIVSNKVLDSANDQGANRPAQAAMPERKPLELADQRAPAERSQAVPVPERAPAPPQAKAPMAASKPEMIPGPGPQKPLVLAHNTDQKQERPDIAVPADVNAISDRTASYSAQQSDQAPPQKQAPQVVSSKMSAMASADAVVAPKSVAGGITISGVRTGEHPGKTRMVLDVSGPSDFKFNVDNKEGLLLIDVASAGWNAPVHDDFKNSPLVSSYTAQTSSDSQGTSIAVALKKPVRVQYSTAMKPNHVYGHRIVLDIVPE